MSKKNNKRKKPEILFGKKEVKTNKIKSKIPFHLDDKGRRV